MTALYRKSPTLTELEGYFLSSTCSHLVRVNLKTLLQVRLELTTSALLCCILSYKYRALTDCATGASAVTGREVGLRTKQATVTNHDVSSFHWVCVLSGPAAVDNGGRVRTGQQGRISHRQLTHSRLKLRRSGTLHKAPTSEQQREWKKKVTCGLNENQRESEK